MSPRFVVVCASLVASAAALASCYSFSAAESPDAGSIEAGPAPEGSVPDASSTDAAADTAADARPDASFVRLTYANCPTFTSCRSDPTGSWTVANGCVSVAFFAPAKSACSFTERDVEFDARGTLDASNGTISRTTELKMSARLDVGAFCRSGDGGCTKVAERLRQSFAVTNCVDDIMTGGCTCLVSSDVTEQTSATYVAGASSFKTLGSNGGGGDRTYDQCVAADALKFRETTTAIAHSFPGLLLVLTK